jgi:Flp pilus assembly protein protease CpaA
VVVAATFVAAVHDARNRRIPNRLTGPLFLAGLAASFLAGGAADLLDAILASIVLAVPYVLLWRYAGGGAGDAKLMGAIGAWLGVVWGTVALFSVSVTGIVFAFAFARARNKLETVLADTRATARGVVLSVLGGGSLRQAAGLLPLPEDGQKMPYGIAIFAGVVLAAGGAWVWRS